MKLRDLMSALREEQKDRGMNCEIYFSKDEEGNIIRDSCYIRECNGYIAIYPCGKCID